MNFYPTLKIEFHTALPADEVIDRIRNRIETKKIFIGGNWLSDKKYAGIVIKNKFLIRNQVSGLAPLNPELKGLIEDMENGSKITLVSSPTLLNKIFMGVWLGLAGIAAVSVTVTAIIKQEFSWVMLVPYGFFAFGYGLMWFSVMLGTEPDDEILYNLLGKDY